MTITDAVLSPGILPGLEEVDVHWRSARRDGLAGLGPRAFEAGEFFGAVEQHDLGGVLITDWVCPPMEGIRGRSFGRQDEDALLVFIASAGRQIMQTAEETVVLRPGTVLLMSSRTTGQFVIPERLTKRTVKVPMTALAPLDTGGGLAGCLLLETARSPLATLFQDFLMSMDPQVGRMSAAEVEGARNALLALIASLIRASHAEPGDSGLLPLLRRRLEEWIVKHLADGAIRVADLATAHNVAPRTVHRAFASTGDTFRSVVRANRLAAARTDLVNTKLCLAAIAHRWGFCDASHFCREFRREFSLSPGDYREAYGFA